MKKLQINRAHSITKGAGITVAVVDTGVDRHPDLVRNLLPGKNFADGGAANGQSDEHGHGTSMAGLIAGHGRGGRGVLGIAPEAKVLPVKDQGPNDRAAGVRLPQGIEWAAENGAQVINVSASTAPTVSMNQAIYAAKRNDVLVVAGSGNRPDFLEIGFPASMPGVLAVGSSDRANKHASFSVEGKAIQLCAPGVDIQSTGLNGSYHSAEGTSDSTAIVSGAAALVRAKFPELTAPEVIDRLTSTATDIGPPGRDEQCGFGVLNIVKALTADVPGGDNGDAGPSVSASADEPSGADVAQPGEPDDENTLALVASVGGGALVLGSLLAFLLVRRQGTT